MLGCWHLTWAQLPDASILLKFLLETRLESASFEALIVFLTFLLKNL